MIGQILGARYRVIDKLGQGAMGEVWLAEHLTLGRREAIKVLQPQVAVDPQFVWRFRREARATNRVQHPNIVSMYDFGQMPDGRFFLAMEYVEGRRLDAVLETDSPLPLPRALHILMQMCRAMDHAHGRGVVHRDIKPSNVVLVEHRGQQDVVKMLDFGIAKIIAAEYNESIRLTREGEIFGTPTYMAPEQFTSPGGDPRSDIYALGCVGYELIVGEPPFVGRPMALMHQHNTKPPTPPGARRTDGSVPPELDAVILRCLEKAPDRRYATAAELLKELTAVQSAVTRAAAQQSRARLSAMRPALFGEGEDTAQHGQGGTNDRPESTFVEPNSSGVTTEAMSPLDARAEMQHALMELAEALVDHGAGDANLTLAVAEVRAQDGLLAGADAESHALETKSQEIEQSLREREGSMRFALGELKFDREQARAEADDPSQAGDLDFQIAQLEKRLAALLQDATRELDALDRKRVDLATEHARLAQGGLEAYGELERVVERIIPRFEHDLTLAPLIDRYRTIRELIHGLG